MDTLARRLRTIIIDLIEDGYQYFGAGGALGFTSREYSKGCMHKRNRHLVDNSSACVCYLTEKTGGTAYTVEYAQRMNLRIINAAEEKKQAHCTC